MDTPILRPLDTPLYLPEVGIEMKRSNISQIPLDHVNKHVSSSVKRGLNVLAKSIDPYQPL